MSFPRQETSSAGSRFPPTRPPMRTTFLTSSCSSPPANPSFLLSPRGASTPSQSPIMKSKIDTKSPDDRNLCAGQGEATELELLRRQEPLNVVIHSGGGGLANTCVIFSKAGSCADACDTNVADTKTNRWSFCYGESDMLDLFPKITRSTVSRDDIRLLEPRCGRTKRPSGVITASSDLSS